MDAGEDAEAVLLLAEALLDPRGPGPRLGLVGGAQRDRREVVVQGARARRHRVVEQDPRSAPERRRPVQGRVEAPAVTGLVRLQQTEIREQAFAVLGELALHRSVRLRSRPGRGAQTRARAVGILVVAPSELVLCERRDLGMELVVRSHDQAGRVVHVLVVVAAQRQLGVEAEVQLLVEHPVASAGLEQLGELVRPGVALVVRPQEAAVERVLISLVLEPALHDVAVGLGLEVGLPIGLRVHRDGVGELIARVGAELARRGLGAALVTQAELALLLPCVRTGAQAIPLGREVHEIGRPFAIHAQDVGVAPAGLRAQRRVPVEVVAEVRCKQLAVLAGVPLVDSGGAELEPVVQELHGRAGARHHRPVAVVLGFVLHHDEDGIESRSARNRPTEEQGAPAVIDVVVGVPRQGLAAQHHFGPEPVARLDGDLLAVQDQGLSGEPVETRGSIAAQLVADEPLVRLGREGAESQPIALVLGLEAREAAAVASQLRHGHAGVVVPEQRVELGALELEVELAARWGGVILLVSAPVERVVLLRVDLLSERLGLPPVAPAGVVRHGQQPLALDPTLREQRRAPLVIPAILDVELLERLHVPRQRRVGQRALGQTDQHPVAILGLDPDVQLLFAIEAQRDVQGRPARLGRGRQLDPGHPVALHGVLGALRSQARQGSCVEGVALLLRHVAALDRERSDRPLACRPTPAVAEAHGHHDGILAVGHQAGRLGHQDGLDRGARIVELVCEVIDDPTVAVARDHLKVVGPVDHVDAAEAADRLGLRRVDDALVEVEGRNALAVQLDLELQVGSVHNREIHARARRRELRTGQQPFELRCGALEPGLVVRRRGLHRRRDIAGADGLPLLARHQAHRVGALETTRDPGCAQPARRRDRSALAILGRCPEAREGLADQWLRARDPWGDPRSELELSGPAALVGPHPVGDRAPGLLGVGNGLSVEAAAAGLVVNALGEHDHRGEPAHRDAAPAHLDGVADQIVFDPRVQPVVHIARRGRTAPHVEVRAPERTALHVHELREAATGEARVLHAGLDLEVGRHAVRVDLDHVNSGIQALEVVETVLIGDGVGAVFEVHADARHALQGGAVARVTGAERDLTHHEGRLAEELLPHEDDVAGGV